MTGIKKSMLENQHAFFAKIFLFLPGKNDFH
jgi:hypothetical protein